MLLTCQDVDQIWRNTSQILPGMLLVLWASCKDIWWKLPGFVNWANQISTITYLFHNTWWPLPVVLFMSTHKNGWLAKLVCYVAICSSDTIVTIHYCLMCQRSLVFSVFCRTDSEDGQVSRLYGLSTFKVCAVLLTAMRFTTILW